uniref:Uncharacterized protein n=1 Tax=Sphaerodactylus townsendi TaxID=933632 RepID=A0ACB8EC50_9SAUR
MMEDKDENHVERVYEIKTLLKGEVAAWLVGLFKEDAPELTDFDQSMISLHRCFEDPLLEEKVWDHLQQLKQGYCLVADYESEFCQLASHLQNWPKHIFIHMFKDGLDSEVLQWALAARDLNTLMGWICLKEVQRAWQRGTLSQQSAGKRTMNKQNSSHHSHQEAGEMSQGGQEGAKCHLTNRVGLALETAESEDEESADKMLDNKASSETSGNDHDLT